MPCACNFTFRCTNLSGNVAWNPGGGLSLLMSAVRVQSQSIVQSYSKQNPGVFMASCKRVKGRNVYVIHEANAKELAKIALAMKKPPPIAIPQISWLYVMRPQNKNH